jgi:hypothetical protein
MSDDTNDDPTRPAIPAIAQGERQRAKATSQAVDLGVVLGMLELADADAGKLTREDAIRRIVARAMDDGIAIEATRTQVVQRKLDDAMIRLKR